MAAWRSLGTLVAVVVLASAAGAETFNLAESPKAGDCFRYELKMSLKGEIKIMRSGKTEALPLAAEAEHHFPERVLIVGPKGNPQKVARAYEAARAVIIRGTDRSERTLRPEHRLVVAQRPKDQLLVYCPSTQLTREEVELTGEHFDTLALTGLLPGKAVAVGDTWKPTNEVVQALCSFEGLTAQDLTCKLERVQEGTAQVSVTGTAAGIDLGAMAKLKIEGKLKFEVSGGRLTELVWKQRDERGQGPASPATTVETTTTVRRSAIPQPASLSDVALIAVPDGFEAPGPLTQLSYPDPKGRFELLYPREWQTVAQTDERLVLRLLDNGDFVAQVTITPYPRSQPGQHISPTDFQEAMARTPGWEQRELLQAGEVPSDAGRWAYRIAAQGRMDGLDVVQTFYVVAGPNGQQVVFAFTTTQTQAAKLGTRDLSMVGSVEFKK